MAARILSLWGRPLAAAGNALRKFWWWLRQMSGDAAYENYLCRAGHSGGQEAPCPAHRPAVSILSAEQFYLERLKRRYSGVSRCC